MNDEIQSSLEICRDVAKCLKAEYPNQVMAIKDNTIIEFSKKNSRLIHSARGSMSGCHAFYTNATPHRIIIKQKILSERRGWLGLNWYALDPIMEYCKRLYRFGKCGNCGVKFDDEYRTKYMRKLYDGKKGPLLYGTIALVELMCHELAHHQTSGHGHGFKVKYARFWNFMESQILTGKFEIPGTEIDQLKKALVEVRA